VRTCLPKRSTTPSSSDWTRKNPDRPQIANAPTRTRAMPMPLKWPRATAAAAGPGRGAADPRDRRPWPHRLRAGAHGPLDPSPGASALILPRHRQSPPQSHGQDAGLAISAWPIGDGPGAYNAASRSKQLSPNHNCHANFADAVMRLSSAIGYIGKVRTVVRTGPVWHACDSSQSSGWMAAR